MRTGGVGWSRVDVRYQITYRTLSDSFIFPRSVPIQSYINDMIITDGIFVKTSILFVFAKPLPNSLWHHANNFSFPCSGLETDVNVHYPAPWTILHYNTPVTVVNEESRRPYILTRLNPFAGREYWAAGVAACWGFYQDLIATQS